LPVAESRAGRNGGVPAHLTKQLGVVAGLNPLTKPLLGHVPRPIVDGPQPCVVT